MESMFQNSVSQFDLNLLQEAGTPNQTFVEPNTFAKKQCLRILKKRWKQVSDLVKRGKEANRVLEELQRQLFEKNEECRELCNERNALYNQTTETTNEMQTLVAHNKLLEEKYSDAVNTIAASKIHSMQFKELTVELKNVQNKLKLCERNRLKEKSARELTEENLKRVLTEFVPTKIKGRSWIAKLKKKYAISEECTKYDSLEDCSGDETFNDPPMSPDCENDGCEEDTKIENSTIPNCNMDSKQNDVQASIDITVNNAVVCKTASLDFENVGSVDTGRGSSLAFSDGEKSFHSPDYFMSDESPFNTPPHMYNKCNIISRKDASTSPIPEELLDVCVNSSMETNGDPSNKVKIDPSNCVDAKICDSPTNVTNAGNTDPIILENKTKNIEDLKIKTKQDKFNTSIENNICLINEDSSATATQLSIKNIPGTKLFSPEKSIQENDIHVNDKKEIISKFLVHELPLAYDSISTSKNLHIEKLSHKTNEKYLNADEKHTVNPESVGNSLSRLELPTTPAIFIENMRPNLEFNICGQTMQESNCYYNEVDDFGDSYNNITSEKRKETTNNNISDNPIKDINVFDIPVVESRHNIESNTACKNSNTPNELPTPSILISAAQEPQLHNSKRYHISNQQKCLELNSSNNESIDSSTDKEIEKIISEMTVRRRLISPLPPTPSKFVDREPMQKIIQLSNDTGDNIEHNKTSCNQSTQGIDDYLDLIRKKTMEAMGMFEVIPAFVEKVVQNLSHDKNNQDLLRCLLQKNRGTKSERTLEKNIHTSGEHIDSSFNNIHTNNKDDDELSNDVPTVIVSCSEESVLSTQELRKLNDKIVYENIECASDDDTMQMNDQSENTDQSSRDANNSPNKKNNIEERSAPKVKYNNLTKLQKLKRNMVRKCQIKPDLGKKVKKMRFKPKPIIPVIKRKVTDTDSAATLNDKAVYEKAVKILSKLKANEPVQEVKIIIEDCVKNSKNIKIAQLSNSKNGIKQKLPKENVNHKDSNEPENFTGNSKDTNKSPCRVLRSTSLSSYNGSDSGAGQSKSLLDEIESEMNREVLSYNRKRKISGLQTLEKESSQIMLKCKDDKKSEEIINTKRNGISAHKISLSSSDNIGTEQCKIKARSVFYRKTSSNTSHSLNNDLGVGDVSDEPDDMARGSSKRKTRSICSPETPTTNNNSEVDEYNKGCSIKAKRRGICSRNSSTSRINGSDLSDVSDETDDINCNKVHESQPNRRKSRGICSPKTPTSDTNNSDVDDGKKDKSVKEKKRSICCRKISLNHSNCQDDVSEDDDKLIESSKRKIPVICLESFKGSNLGVYENKEQKLINMNIPSSNSCAVSLLNDQALRDGPDEPNDTVQGLIQINGPDCSHRSACDHINDIEDSNNFGPEPEPTKKRGDNDFLTKTALSHDNDISVPNKRRKLSVDQNVTNSSSYTKKIEKIDDKRNDVPPKLKTRNKSMSISDHEGTPKRTLRSSAVNQNMTVLSDGYNQEVFHPKTTTVHQHSSESRRDKDTVTESNRQRLLSSPIDHKTSISYTDLDMFSDVRGNNENVFEKCAPNPDNKAYTKNILCSMIDKYGVHRSFHAKKIPESVMKEKCDKLEGTLDNIVSMPHNSCMDAMNRLVAEISNWNVKHFISALMKYLQNPQRKLELFKKTNCPPAPPMTKKEQILIYIIDQLNNNCFRGVVERILHHIEYMLFALNRTPEIVIIEGVSHFYALICRYYQKQSKLRLFIIDAMYCLSYKSIPLIKQCLEVWVFILPLGHMSLAKTPLVSCLVYLLHFYKCDKDAYSCVTDLRTLLYKKYYYDFSEWNETKVLDMFRTSIKELRDFEVEKKMLRIALIILAKRNGPKWCQSNIITNMLQPLIESPLTSDVAKRFCILALGPLVKPYPNEMKSYSEIVAHYLMTKLEQMNTQKMQEAIVSSLLFMNKHNNKINDFLLEWNPDRISPEFEEIMKDYVRWKPIKTWKNFLANYRNI